jgi:hypothetical protein
VIKNLRFWSMGSPSSGRAWGRCVVLTGLGGADGHTAAASGFSVIYDVTEKDRIYTALPLYHSAGGVWLGTTTTGPRLALTRPRAQG